MKYDQYHNTFIHLSLNFIIIIYLFWVYECKHFPQNQIKYSRLVKGSMMMMMIISKAMSNYVIQSKINLTVQFNLMGPLNVIMFCLL